VAVVKKRKTQVLMKFIPLCCDINVDAMNVAELMNLVLLVTKRFCVI
jgi:hypothetical protein